jgi:hypothetical protein
MKDFTEVKIPTQLVLLLFVHSVCKVYTVNIFGRLYMTLYLDFYLQNC